MPDDKAPEFDIDVRKEGAAIIFDPKSPPKAQWKFYDTKAPCGTPNPCTVPPTHLWIEMAENVVVDLKIENEQ